MRRSLLRRPLTAAAALTALAASLLVTTGGQAQAATAGNGPLLYPGTSTTAPATLQSLTTGTGRSIGVNLESDAKTALSPDGRRLVTTSLRCARATCPDDEGLVTDLLLFATSGAPRVVAAVPGAITGLSWSGDGRQVALLTFVFTSGAPTVERLVVVDVATGATRTVLEAGSSGQAVRYVHDLAWNPVTGAIAISRIVTGDLDQISLVDPATGALTAFTSDDQEFCDADPCDPFDGYSGDLDWSPDGTVLAAAHYARTPKADGSGSTIQRDVALVRSGDTSPSAILPGTTGVTAPLVRWSPSGSAILVDGAQAATGSIITLFDGSSRTVRHGAQDWQACPGGTCATWPTSTRRIAVTAPVTRVTGRGIRLSGTVSPNRGGRLAGVELQVRVDGRWRQVGYKVTRLSPGSRISVAFPTPKVRTCRAVVRLQDSSDGAFADVRQVSSLRC